jgi:GT2 family glycosyltransferase
MQTAAIIIPHYDDMARLNCCLAALIPQLVPEVDVIVVDNGSTESLDTIHAAYPGLRVVTEHLKGAANARNRGVAETTAPYLFFLDCDCIPAPDWLAMALQLATQADIIGGEIAVFDETPPPRSGAEAFETVFAFDNRSYVEKKGFSVTASLLTRRDVFNDVGPFRHGVSEDLDWCRRAGCKGYRLVYAADLRVSHPSRSDWPALRRKWRRLTDELFLVNGTKPRDRLRWGAKALAMPFSIMIHAPRVLRHTALRGSRERVAGLGTLVRLRLTRALWMLRQAIGLNI